MFHLTNVVLDDFMDLLVDGLIQISSGVVEGKALEWILIFLFLVLAIERELGEDGVQYLQG